MNGHINFQILKKMQSLKKELKSKCMSNHIKENLKQAEQHLNDMQTLMHFDPSNLLFAKHEHLAVGSLRIKADFALYIRQ